MVKFKALLLGLGLYLLAHGIAFASSRTKTDIVYMRNGDKITGEIQSLSQGQLTVKPDYTSSGIVLDWNKVDHVESPQQFIVTDPEGKQYYGSLSGEPGSVVVRGDAPKTLNHEHVIQVDELGTTFMKRLRGDADFGTSFARSNSQKSLTLQTDLQYQSTKYLSTINTSSQYTSQQKTNNTNEFTAKSTFFRQLNESNWYSGGFANFLSSSEQQIDLRTTLGGGVAKRQIFTNKTNLTFVGGLAYTKQNNSAGNTAPSNNNSLDATLAAQYSTFRFDAMTFNTNFWLYPSITEAGRVRFTLNQDIYYKFLSDFYVRMSFYDNYDNKPVVGTPSNNLGATTTLGWSFH